MHDPMHDDYCTRCHRADDLWVVDGALLCRWCAWSVTGEDPDRPNP